MRELAGYTFLLAINDNDADDVLANLPSMLYRDAGAATDALVVELSQYVQNDDGEPDQATARGLFDDNVEEPTKDDLGNPAWDFNLTGPEGPDLTVRIYPMYWGV